MSEYFRVLNRLFEEKRGLAFAEPRRAAIARAPAPGASPEPWEAPERPSPPPRLRLLKPALAPPAPPSSAPAAFQEMLDVLQHLRSTAATRCLVLAAAGAEDAASLATRVAARAHDSELCVEVIRVTRDVTAGKTGSDSVEELYLDVQRDDWMTRLATWQATMSSDSVAILVAPPLSKSSNAALIARGCDGLAVLVELGKTTGQELAQAIKRARATECQLFGLIAVGSDGLPPWGRRLLQSLGKFDANES